MYLLAPEQEICLSKALVFPCFLVFDGIGEYISLHLFSFSQDMLTSAMSVFVCLFVSQRCLSACECE